MDTRKTLIALALLGVVGAGVAGAALAEELGLTVARVAEALEAVKDERFRRGRAEHREALE